MTVVHSTASRVLSFSLVVLCVLAVGSRAQEVLLSFGGPLLYLKGNQPQPLDWRALDFDDFTWEEGRTPIGYGDAGTQTTLEDMAQEGANPGYASVFLRFKFEVEDPYPIEKMTMKVSWDDGFVAYLNGALLASKNMANTNNPPHNTFSSGDHEYTTDPELAIDVSSKVSLLLIGQNVLAVQVHNTSLTSSDLWFDTQLEIDFRINPFPCIEGVSCTDLGDGVVAVAWTNPGGLDGIQIREGDEVVFQAEANANAATIEGVPAGQHFYRVFGMVGGEECYGGVCSIDVSAVQNFRRGDVNDDGMVNIIDPVFLAHFIFQNGEEPVCQDAGDFDDSGALKIEDIVGLLGYLFQSEPPPPMPGPKECGPDDKLDNLPRCLSQQCQPQ